MPPKHEIHTGIRFKFSFQLTFRRTFQRYIGCPKNGIEIPPRFVEVTCFPLFGVLRALGVAKVTMRIILIL